MHPQFQHKMMPVAVGSQTLADDSAGEAIGEQWFHYTLDNKEASKRQLSLFTLLNTLSAFTGL